MKKQLLYISTLVILLLYSCKETSERKGVEETDGIVLKDYHVHIMSPNLINDWKAVGIPFSQPNYNYSDIDTILKTNKASYINLIGMGYVYGNPEFYKENEEYSKVKQENNFLFQSAKKHPNRIRSFFTVDPLKEYAIAEIERCLNLNDNAGLKLHFSSSQVYLTEPEHLKKVKSIFKIASKNKLPILLHFDNGHPKFGRPDITLLIDKILLDLDPITLIIAHFGTSGGFNQKTKNIIDTFVEFYENDKIPKKHTILFDISAVALDKDSEGVKKLSEGEFKELKVYCDKIGYEKIVFGTDYPLYNSSGYIEILKTKLKLSETELKKISD